MLEGIVEGEGWDLVEDGRGARVYLLHVGDLLLDLERSRLVDLELEPRHPEVRVVGEHLFLVFEHLAGFLGLLLETQHVRLLGHQEARDRSVALDLVLEELHREAGGQT